LGGGSGMRSSLPMPPSPGRGDKAKGVGSSDDKPAAVTPAPPTASLTGLLRGLSPIQSGSTASTSTAQSGAVDIAPSPSPSPITVANTAGVALAATARSSKDKGMGGGGEGFAPISANIFAAPATKTPSPVAVPAVQSVDPPIPSIHARQPQSAAPPPSKPSGGNVSASSATTKPKTPSASSSSSAAAATAAATAVTPEFDALRRALQPVTSQELQDALHLLRYDVHKEIQAITREQVRQFAIAKVS